MPLKNMETSEIDSLETLMDFVREKYPVTHDTHPGLFAGSNPTADDKRLATVRHNLVHMNKRLGKIASAIHDHDHGGTVDLSVLKPEVAKFMVELLKFAEATEVSAADLYREVPEVMTSA